MDAKTLRPFLLIIIAWALLVALAAMSIEFGQLMWAYIIGFLAIADIFCTAKALQPFFRSSESDAQFSQKNQGLLLFQAFTWGSIKLVSLTLLGFIFFKVKDLPVSVYGLGLSVFVIVPLFGGVLWYFENKSDHATQFTAAYDDSEWGQFKRREPEGSGSEEQNS